MLNDLIKAALPGLEAILAAFAALALAYLRNLIAAHTKNQTVEGIETRLVSAVADVVAEFNQTVVEDLKSANRFDAAAARDVLHDALVKLKDHLGPELVTEIEKVLQPTNLEAMLITRIESEVGKQSSYGRLVPPAVAP